MATARVHAEGGRAKGLAGGSSRRGRKDVVGLAAAGRCLRLYRGAGAADLDVNWACLD
jgi:hypothetical protein